MGLDLDGRGRYEVQTGIRFLDHMLELVARHNFHRPAAQLTDSVSDDEAPSELGSDGAFRRLDGGRDQFDCAMSRPSLSR